MSRISFNVGATANDGNGDTLRGAFQAVEANFTELYTLLGNGSDLPDGSISLVATTGRYSDLSGKPILGSAAAAEASSFAPAGQALPAGGAAGQMLVKQTGTDYDVTWVAAPSGSGLVDSVNGETGTVVLTPDDLDDTSTVNKFVTEAELDAIASAIQPGDLATVATTGSYSSLTGRPPLGTASASNAADFAAASHTHTLAAITDAGSAAAAETTDFATAAQGQLADTALQSGDLASVATSGSYNDLTDTPTFGSAAGAETTDFAPNSHTHNLSEIEDAGSAAGAETTDFATAAQGAKADIAVTSAPSGAAGQAIGNFIIATTAELSDAVSQNPTAVVLEVDSY